MPNISETFLGGVSHGFTREVDTKAVVIELLLPLKREMVEIFVGDDFAQRLGPQKPQSMIFGFAGSMMGA